MKKFKPVRVEFDNTVQVRRFWFLVVDAIFTGYISAMNPNMPASEVGKEFVKLTWGTSSIAVAIISIALAMVAGRFWSPKLLRIAHAFAAGFYFIFGVGLITAVFFLDEEGVNGMHLIVIAWLHLNAGIDLPPLVKNHDGEKDDGSIN